MRSRPVTSAKQQMTFIFSAMAALALCPMAGAEPPPSPRLTEPFPASNAIKASFADQALQVSPAVPDHAENGDDGYVAASIGPDLIVGHVFECEQLGREGPLGSGTIGMSCYTTACTIGDLGTNWYGLPDVDHPVISVNFFRLRTLDGTDRLEQIGQSWLKHGFGTALANECGLGCTGGNFNVNGPGCSDTYAASQFVPCDLGPRSMINPYTGVMPASVDLGPSSECNPPGREFMSYPSNDHRDHDHNEISHRLQVRDVDLMPSLNPGAKYFAEGQYLTPHEFVDGNGSQNNNASYRRIRVSGGDECSGGFQFTDLDDTFSEQPAINAWPDAAQTLIEPAPLVDGRGFLVYKVTDLGSVWRYEYALYNMNMDRAMSSLSIPLPSDVAVSNIGFHAPLNHAPEPHTVNYTNTPWSVSTTGGAVTWSTEAFATNPFANAVRFGTMYNFWFDANMPPQSASATIGLFKTSGTIGAATLGPSVPGVLDCNANTIEDRCDLDCGLSGCAVPGCGTKVDCNANGVPDDCEPDCNGNGIADRCDIADSFSEDCDADAIPDSCEGFADCDGNTVRDDCEIFLNPGLDSNGNGVHDSCESQSGSTLYVDDDAPDDPWPGWPYDSDPDENGTPDHPFDAIVEAINAASTGDTVIVLDGVYRGFGYNNRLLFRGKTITVRSKNGPDNCVIDLENDNYLAIFDGGSGPAMRFEGFHVANISTRPQLSFPTVRCFGSSPTISHCKFTGFGSLSSGVGTFENSRAEITHCTFIGLNRAIHCDASRPVVSNCLVSGGNTGVLASGGNGGTDCLGASSPRIQNATITGAATGISANAGSVPIIENSIVWGNTSSQITLDMSSAANVSYSDVQGGWSGMGNIDADPLFAPGGGDIVAGSPCIDAGNNAVSSLPETDLGGGPRLFDDPATADTGAGTAPLVDIGAAEWSDCNGNSTEDSQEVDGQPGIDCNGNRVPDECEVFADCNNNTTRDICDIAAGTSQDCNENSVPDTCDVATISLDCNGNLIPDECEADCNRNHVPDECDLTAQTSDDCDGNGVLDECDLANCDGFPNCSDCNNNGIIDFCDIAGPFSDDDNSNGTPDECDPPPPPDIVWSGDPLSADRTTRSLRFSASSPATVTATPALSAVKVTMIDLQNPSPPNLALFPPKNLDCWEAGAACGTVIPSAPPIGACTGTGEDPAPDAAGSFQGGCARWVGKPATFMEFQGPPPSGPFRAARLQCTPFYFDWAAETAGGPIAVVGAEIVPSSEYSVQAYGASCKGGEGGCTNVSAPVAIYTRRSGDVASEFNPPATTEQPNSLDVTVLVNKFKAAAGAPVKAIAQLQPNLVELNQDVGALDIVACVDAVKQLAYAYSGPCPCPSQATCGALPCSTPGTCTGSALPGLGQSATCVLTCAGGENAGDPCISDAHCNGGACGNGFCRDRCGRCTP